MNLILLIRVFMKFYCMVHVELNNHDRNVHDVLFVLHTLCIKMIILIRCYAVLRTHMVSSMWFHYTYVDVMLMMACSNFM